MVAMYMKNHVCSAKRKKVQTLEKCFRLLALISMQGVAPDTAGLK